jgi:hypothetical protein
MPNEAITTALQLAIGPVILISAVGLLLLTLNNRLVASITRVRVLSNERTRLTDEGSIQKIDRQLVIIWKRAQLLRLSIELMSASALFSSALVMSLFMQAALNIYVQHVSTILFMLSLTCIIGGLCCFIYETRQALGALGLELKGTPGINQ